VLRSIIVLTPLRILPSLNSPQEICLCRYQKNYYLLTHIERFAILAPLLGYLSVWTLIGYRIRWSPLLRVR